MYWIVLDLNCHIDFSSFTEVDEMLVKVLLLVKLGSRKRQIQVEISVGNKVVLFLAKKSRLVRLRVSMVDNCN